MIPEDVFDDTTDAVLSRPRPPAQGGPLALLLAQGSTMDGGSFRRLAAQMIDSGVNAAKIASEIPNPAEPGTPLLPMPQ